MLFGGKKLTNQNSAIIMHDHENYELLWEPTPCISIKIERLSLKLSNFDQNDSFLTETHFNPFSGTNPSHFQKKNLKSNKCRPHGTDKTIL